MLAIRHHVPTYHGLGMQQLFEEWASSHFADGKGYLPIPYLTIILMLWSLNIGA